MGQANCCQGRPGAKPATGEIKQRVATEAFRKLPAPTLEPNSEEKQAAFYDAPGDGAPETHIVEPDSLAAAGEGEDHDREEGEEQEEEGDDDIGGFASLRATDPLPELRTPSALVTMLHQQGHFTDAEGHKLSEREAISKAHRAVQAENAKARRRKAGQEQGEATTTSNSSNGSGDDHRDGARDDGAAPGANGQPPATAGRGGRSVSIVELLRAPVVRSLSEKEEAATLPMPVFARKQANSQEKQKDSAADLN